MQYDFNLSPNTSTTMEVAGKFFKYKSGTGPIRVRSSKGGVVDLLPGQGVWNVDFTSLTIADRSGAQNVGVILAGDFDFHDDRITGTVDIVDGGKTRTLAGLAFMGSGNATGAANAQDANLSEFPYVQLFNPIGSGKNIVVETMTLSASAAAQVDFGPYNVQLASVFPNPPLSKKYADPVPSTVAQIRRTGSAGYLLSNSFGNVLVSANQSVTVKFTEPVLITPGWSLTVAAEARASKLVVTFEYFEDAI